MADAFHRPVMVQEALEMLGCSRGGIFLDATVGSGGHAREILERTDPSTRLIGIDRDPDAIGKAAERLKPFGQRVVLRHGNYAELRRTLGELGIEKVRGILFDLGARSDQLLSPIRGFSFRYCAPLDMRYDAQQSLTAHTIINTYSEEELSEIFWLYGEERYARRIARRIVQYRSGRPITTTTELAEIILKAIPKGAKRGRIHPATRSFQALRIATNGELIHLEKGLQEAIRCLEPEGRLVTISYHSLEDRMVKRIHRAYEKGCMCPEDLPVCRCKAEKALRILTRKPLRPRPEEIETNPSSRSARLRAAERL